MQRARFVSMIVLSCACFGFDDPPPSHPSPSDAGRVASASTEPNAAKAEMRLPKDVKVELYASEPLVANPVAFHFDNQGRCYVIETFRHTDAVTDNREHMYWLDADLAARTVEDRVAMYKKFLPDSFGQFSATEDRVRRLVDKNGDRRAETATVFAEGFSSPADGIAAGILARGDDVYLASIPALWRLRDSGNTGKADSKEALHTGYGVHVAFLGHDLHGLRFGPDGRLYFSIGDRGLNVKTKEGTTLVNPDSGAILRCEPDGSHLEIIAYGLRNPQELAFDDFGNLFTVDNNSDSGDKARAVYVVEGGDSGWRIGYQYIENPTNRGPWNGEKLWYPRWDGQAAYILPPLINLSDGPSGFTREPGVSLLPDRYRGHFFLADFRGAHGQSGIRSFRFQPKGASFEVVDQEQFVWQVLATDVDFGPDGALYVSDWVDGWRKTGKGRIWRFADPSKSKSAAVAEVEKLLREGMNERSVKDLIDLLAHADQRVRQEAQFCLADRAKKEILENTGVVAPGKAAMASSLDALVLRAESDGPLLARIHAIWAIGQVGRQYSKGTRALAGLLKDQHPEIRVQTAKVVGDVIASGRTVEGLQDPVAALVSLLADAEPRVQLFVAQALGKTRAKSAVAALVKVLEQNNDLDAYLRHAVAVALAAIGDETALAKLSTSPSAAVRMGAILALRRLASPELSRFLADKAPDNAREAARAIYEAPVDRALGDLARLNIPATAKSDEPLLRRIIAANERVGGVEAAKSLIAIGRDSAIPEAIRVEAFETLAQWGESKLRDRINGLHRPVDARPTGQAAEALGTDALALIQLQPAKVRIAAIAAISGAGIKTSGPDLKKIALDKQEAGSVRLAALSALDQLGDAGLAQAVTESIEDRDPKIRSQAHRLLAKLDPELAIETLTKVWKSGTIRERQNVAQILGGLANPKAEALLADALGTLAAGKLPAEVELDVREAAEKRSSNASIRDRLAGLAPKGDDPVAGYKACLQGGDAERGAKVFRVNTAVECLRCHRILTKGGEVGPELTGIGQKRSREYLLEAIVTPNKAIAEGFESVVVARTDGTIVTGVFRGEDATHLRLVTNEGQLIAIPKSDIEERKRGPSAMPDDLAKKLSKSEIRDLIEFLATIR